MFDVDLDQRRAHASEPDEVACPHEPARPPRQPYQGQTAACKEPSMATYYQIRVRGGLAPHWSAWFDGLTITNQASGDTLLAGPLIDQAALHGVLIKIRDLGLPLLAVNRLDDPPQQHES